jgi:20S proteasome alpha/beta subunit
MKKMRMMITRNPLLLVSVSLLLQLSTQLVNGAASSPAAKNIDGKGFPLAGMGPDPFVAAAPLVVAAVCSDGVVLAALHTIFSNEPLLLVGDDDEDDDADHNTTLSMNATRIRDLPKGYRGSFRIHSIDGFGTGLICAGWRADARILADVCRSLAGEELDVYGTPPLAGGEQYGEMLASQAAVWMAEYASSDQYRSLSTVGLLAACGPESGYLWLIDATGGYRVRAHAVGSLAGLVNERLQAVDWSQYDKEEVAKKLIEMMSELEEVPSEARIELASISSDQSGNRRLQRLFSSRLFGVARKQ